MGESLLLPLLCSSLLGTKALSAQIEELAIEVANISARIDEIQAGALAGPSKPDDVLDTLSALPVSYEPEDSVDIPCYSTTEHKWYRNSVAYAAKFRRSWEAQTFREGKYPPLSEFHPHPSSARQIATQSDAQAASSGKGGRGKGKRKKQPTTAAQVAAGEAHRGNAVSSRNPPAAERRFFAPHAAPSPYPQSNLIAASRPDVAHCVLREADCTPRLSFSSRVNDRGVVTLLVLSPITPATACVSYYDVLMAKLNQSFPVGDSLWLSFRPAHNEVHLAGHSHPIEYLPADDSELFLSIKNTVLSVKEVQIFSTRYLNPDRPSRILKKATSVGVTVASEHEA
ncbi:hypothetical protein C7212DRAFT_347251 [Tuber magnatum]|uniref:Uncharacterized protein n=1 Tax=Tuber magnatum TaxID=42249 RepID=A0A317SFD5_9PEZI|nr:hypothetical protein C7212DRAFT_347251 [Tuber magnatum]